MNRMRLMFYACMVLVVLLAACAPASTPTPSAAATTLPTASSTGVSLAGPPMQVGSTYLYYDGTTLVAVPGGPFIMGHGGTDDPVHTVTLSDFWIYSTKVTNQQYQYCVNMQKCDPPDLTDNQGYNDFTRSNDPVVGVNYADAAAYCDFAHGQLPTEAQWEKTARGPNGNIYPWGNNAPSRDLLNYNDYIGQTTNVTNYPQGKSYYDALDMEGNAYEWVSDWYDPLYYKTGPTQDPPGPDTGQDRSVRSAGYKSNDDQVPSSVRSHSDPTYHARDLGFRCVVNNPAYFAPFCQVVSLEGPNVSGSNSPASTPLCPKIGVSVSYAGCGTNAYAIVTFDDPPVFNTPDKNAHITVGPGCTPTSPGGHFAKYICSNIPPGGFDVSISSECGWLSFTQTCPADYNLKGGMCIWDGSGTQGLFCWPGFTYDPSTQCCSSSNGTGTNFPACPVGTVLQGPGNGVYFCAPQQNAGNVNPASAHVDQPTNQCGSTGGNPGSCVVGGACGAASTGHYNANCVCVP